MKTSRFLKTSPMFDSIEIVRNGAEVLNVAKFDDTFILTLEVPGLRISGQMELTTEQALHLRDELNARFKEVSHG